MPEDVKESPSSTAVAEPSYQPPTNEPQGLEPAKEPEVKETIGAEVKEPTVQLPKSIKPPTKSGRFQERISDLVNQRDLSKREAEQLREEVSRLRGVSKPGGGETKEKTDGVLNPEDYPTYGEYVKAVTEETIRKREEAAQSKQAQTKYEEHKAERMTTFNEHAAPLAQQYGEGFWDTITDPSLPITEAMADAVMELDELGPFTMLYLAAHRDEASKIAKMNPRAATMAIGRLAAQIDYEIKQGGEAGTTDVGSVGTATPVQPTAPRPSPVPVPRGSSPGANNNLPNDKDSVDEWLRKETDRLRRINPNARFYGAR